MKKVQKNKLSITGIIFIVLLVIIGVFLIFVLYLYDDIKRMEQGVYNLYNEMRTTNSKIESLGMVDESSAQKTVNFTEATKNWQIYQNDDFNFQLKSPASWGNFIFEQDEVNRINGGYFENFVDKNKLNISLMQYNSETKKFASSQVKQIVDKSKMGECSNKLFETLKKLGIGEIRNCFVYENILHQKYITYRYVKSLSQDEQIISQLICIYPRDEFYLKVNLPDQIQAEEEYFVQSLVFLR